MEAGAVSENKSAFKPNAGFADQASAGQDHLSSIRLSKIDAQLSLYEVLQIEEARQLDAVLASKGESQILLKLGSADNTMRFMRACLRGSYLFGREVVPNYLANVFKSLTQHAPAGDDAGPILRGLTEMCIGEISTNNIYGRAGESHAHFHDLYEAYKEAGGNVEEFKKFLDLADDRGTLAAIKESPGLWSEGAKKYAEKLLSVCADPLASSILMPCNEILSTVIYPVALTHMSNEARFAKFRQFLDVHVQLDGDNHGCVALEWLAHHIGGAKISAEDLAVATKKVLALYQNE